MRLRHAPEGSLDAAFGSGGRVVSSWHGTNASAFGVHIFDHKAYVFGRADYVNAYYHYAGAVTRLDDAGDLDATFGNAGLLATSWSVDNVIHTPAGKLLLSVSSGYDGFVQQIKADGTPDATFGSNGAIVSGSPLPGADYASEKIALALDPGGGILALIGSRSHRRVEAWSFDAIGTRDTTFGSLLVDTAPESPTPVAIRRTADGRFVGLASTYTGTTDKSILMRFFP